MTPPPPIYRAARILRVLATLAIVLLAAFVLTAGASAAQIRPQASGLGSARLTGGNAIALGGNLTVSNPGLYPITGLTVGAAVFLSNTNGTLLATGGSLPTTVPAGARPQIAITATIPLASMAGEFLLTHDARLPTILWANATYAFLFPVHLRLLENLSWGAPFYALNITPGAPSVQGNGSIAVPLTVSFTDHASFGIDGRISFTVESQARSACATGSFAPKVPPGGSYRDTTIAYLTAGCDPSHGVVTSEYVTPSWVLPLPVEYLP